MNRRFISICDVCFLLDMDGSKKIVEFCSVCNSFICDRCRNDWERRAKAALEKIRRSRMIRGTA